MQSRSPRDSRTTRNLVFPPVMGWFCCSTRKQGPWVPFCSIMDTLPTCAPELRGRWLRNTWRERRWKRSRSLARAPRLATRSVRSRWSKRFVKSGFGDDTKKKPQRASMISLAKDLATDCRFVLASSVQEAVGVADVVITVTASHNPWYGLTGLQEEHW